MSVRYKFKNTLSDYDNIIFDGNSISLSDFKKTVVQQKHLSKIDDDLKVVNAETKQEFKTNDDLIPKNTTLIISRVPRTPHQKQKQTVDKRNLTSKNKVNDSNKKDVPPLDNIIQDLSKLNISEENKIEVMIDQSTAAYNPKTYQKTSYNAPISKNYRCSRCHLAGHWVKECPLLAINIPKINGNRRKAGIPKTFLQKEYANGKENTEAELQVIENKPAGVPAPDDLLCPICKEVFVDAVMIPCCGNSFCDDCVRGALLESNENECPACKEADGSPDSLIPNRYLRNTVNSFNNDCGFRTKIVTTKEKQQSSLKVA